jgi:hypothetical protein
MFLLLLALATAQPYSRSYLRGMEVIEQNRYDNQFIGESVQQILNGVLTSAKKGLTSFSVPFEGCEAFVKRGGEGEHMKGVTVSRCKKVVTVIKKTVHNQFPDSRITYEGGVYTLNWD